MITTQHKVEDFLRGFGLGSEEARMASLGIMAPNQPDPGRTRCPLAGLRPVHSRSVSRSVHPTLSHDRVHFLGAFTRPHIE